VRLVSEAPTAIARRGNVRGTGRRRQYEGREGEQDRAGHRGEGGDDSGGGDSGGGDSGGGDSGGGDSGRPRLANKKGAGHSTVAA
jgi:hypothetical protein